MVKTTKSSPAFTLIEVLIVIAIVGVLSAIVLVSLNDSRASARDTRRIADFESLKTGLELFYDKHDVYPCGDANVDIADPTQGTWDTSHSDTFLDGTRGDPSVDCSGSPLYGLYTEGILNNDQVSGPINEYPYAYVYRTREDRQFYVLYVPLEDDPDAMQKDGGLCNNYYETGPGTGTIPLRIHTSMPPCN